MENELETYFDIVIDNYQMLEEEEKNILREMEGTPQAAVLRKVLGPEVGDAFSFSSPEQQPDETERMLTPEPVQETDQLEMPV